MDVHPTKNVSIGIDPYPNLATHLQTPQQQSCHHHWSSVWMAPGHQVDPARIAANAVSQFVEPAGHLWADPRLQGCHHHNSDTPRSPLIHLPRWQQMPPKFLEPDEHLSGWSWTSTSILIAPARTAANASEVNACRGISIYIYNIYLFIHTLKNNNDVLFIYSNLQPTN